MFFHSWHTTARGFGKSRLCSSDPGQANIACLIKSEVLNMGIHPACHHAHAGHSYKTGEFSLIRPGSRQLFTRAQNGQPQPAGQSQCHSAPSSPPTRAWCGSPRRYLLHCGWVIPEGCRMLCPWQKCRANLLVQECLGRASEAFWRIQRC